MALWARGKLGPEARAHPPRSRGDSYDDALAETVNGLYKSELIARAGPWRTVEQVELATADWVHFWNTRRLHSACGDVPPAEFEAAYHQRPAEATAAAESNRQGLHETQGGSDQAVDARYDLSDDRGVSR